MSPEKSAVVAVLEVSRTLPPGCAVTRWDRPDTVLVDRHALLDHDIVVNCVVSRGASGQQPFVTADDVDVPRRLRVVGDVTCDVTSEANLVPINTAVTTWREPVRRFGTDENPLEVIAIDNLPSLLPREASESFSAELTPHLLGLAAEGGPSGPWQAAGHAFDDAIRRLATPPGPGASR